MTHIQVSRSVSILLYSPPASLPYINYRKVLADVKVIIPKKTASQWEEKSTLQAEF
jgi:hypothetical protein